MTTPTVASAAASTKALLRRIERRAKADPDAVMPVLRVLAGEKLEPGPTLRAVALEINRARVAEGRRDFVAHALSTEQVAQHLRVKSRQAIAQRRARGTLLGAKIDNVTYFPAWQFGPDGLATGLDRLFALLREAGVTDARAADDLCRMPHSELGGRTLLDLWQAGEWDRLQAWLGDIGGWQR
jgi:hypothetical protein